MPTSVFLGKEIWDIVVSRKSYNPMATVYIVRKTQKKLLCQIAKMSRFGWTVIVHGDVNGPRLVKGFKSRWQAIEYAIQIRIDLNEDWKNDNIYYSC